jgi:hypothetical protein
MQVYLVALWNRLEADEPLHWLLYIGETTVKGQIYNAVGSSQDFKYESRKVTNIMTDSDYATSTKLCDISKEDSAKLGQALADVQIRNFKPNYNCQAWIRLALRELVDFGFVGSDEIATILETFPKKVKDMQASLRK